MRVLADACLVPVLTALEASRMVDVDDGDGDKRIGGGLVPGSVCGMSQSEEPPCFGNQLGNQKALFALVDVGKSIDGSIGTCLWSMESLLFAKPAAVTSRIEPRDPAHTAK